MLMENLGELRQSIAAFLSVGMEEFQRSEAGGSSVNVHVTYLIEKVPKSAKKQE